MGLALRTALLLLWSNLAVGIIGSENNPVNWMYIGVLAVLAIGVLIARFQPNGMARALPVTGIVQALVTAISLIGAMGQAIEILLVNGFFIVLWTGSALLFRREDATQNR